MTQAQSRVCFRPSEGESIDLRFDELPGLAGRSFQGEWWSVEQERVSQFEAGTYLDALRFPWSEGTFPDRLVEGFHLVGLLDYMMNAVLHLEGEGAFGWNYGLDRVRFISPIKVGEEIRLTGSVAEVRPKGDGFLVRQDCTVEVKDREQPGFIAEWWVYWLPEVPEHD